MSQDGMVIHLFALWKDITMSVFMSLNVFYSFSAKISWYVNKWAHLDVLALCLRAHESDATGYKDL